MKNIIFACVMLLFLPYITVAGTLPDTGQTKCYDNTQEISCPQLGEPFYGQDAQYGLNTHFYTKLDENGNDLPFSAIDWTMVKDEATGLIWEVKQDKDYVQNFTNPHDADNRYTWYESNPATNGGNAGTPGDGTDTEDFINALNAANFGGYNDWRMPTIRELSSIIDNRILYPGPMINTDYFSNVLSAAYFSSTTDCYAPYQAWCVIFYRGDVWYIDKSSNFYVRAVRGGGEQFLNNFIDNGDWTVTDTSTGLMWEVKTDDGGLRDRDNTYNWEEALSYCENLSLAGYDDWRLPNRNELQTIQNYTTYPAVYTDYFPNTGWPTGYYWTSTTDASNPNEVWGVSFTRAAVIGDITKFSLFHPVWAVRGGQCAGLGDSDGDTFCNNVDNCPNDYNPGQEDTYPPQGNGIGDACECEGDFDCDGDIDGSDAFIFKTDFGRSIIVRPCITGDPCNGDFLCDGDVDGTDAFTFKSDFGRSPIQNPCPMCSPGMVWCQYQ